MLTDMRNSLVAVGKKQCLKAVEANNVKCIYIAKDADKHIIDELEMLSAKRGIEIVYVNTGMQLGQACGIDVSAAVACSLIA